MKFKIALVTLLCSVAITPAHAISAHYRAQLERSGCTEMSTLQGCDVNKTKEENAKHSNSSNVPDPLHAIKLKGQDGINNYFIVSIGNGYTKAMIKDEPAKITRKNANWYEITNKDYIIGVYLSEKGFESSSWNRHKGRDHGQLFPVDGE
ncbi:TPA: hypothetical protein SCS57_002057 [Enterobacter cloacae]|nr:hypothetical protein [Enterobacter cloacae]